MLTLIFRIPEKLTEIFEIKAKDIYLYVYIYQNPRSKNIALIRGPKLIIHFFNKMSQFKL